MKIVRSGYCLYDNSVEEPVDIVGLMFDYWHEISRADGDVFDHDDPQPLISLDSNAPSRIQWNLSRSLYVLNP